MLFLFTSILLKLTDTNKTDNKQVHHQICSPSSTQIQLEFHSTHVHPNSLCTFNCLPLTQSCTENSSSFKVATSFNLINATWGRIQKICSQQTANICILKSEKMFSSSIQYLKRHSVLCHGTAERCFIQWRES